MSNKGFFKRATMHVEGKTNVCCSHINLLNFGLAEGVYAVLVASLRSLKQLLEETFQLADEFREFSKVINFRNLCMFFVIYRDKDSWHSIHNCGHLKPKL